MKTIVIFLTVLLIQSSLTIKAQIHVPVKKKVVDKTNQEANSATDQAIDEGFNQIKGLFKKKNKKQGNKAKTTKNEQNQQTPTNQPQVPGDNAGPASPALNWAKYDFVPGDVVIFEDDLEGEENGEFPSRWDLWEGVAEVARVDGENVIMFRQGEPGIIPYMEDPKEDYLPEVFTVEFDLYYPGNGSFNVYLFDKKNQESGSPTGYTYFTIDNKTMEFGQSSSDYPGDVPNARWMHISIAYTKGKLKGYMDDTRLINIPRIDFDPKGITLYTYHASNDNLYYVKNVRIAKGGVKYYDRFMADGKIVTNGIRFETGKADILPESMGVINKIYEMMKEHPDIKLSVEGHTDNVGDADYNLKLSGERAAAVKNKLVSMGIASDRLVTKGWGESNPIDSNDTPEGRANNRRVEFVKI